MSIDLKKLTNARILQDRSGHQPKIKEILAFQEAHAKARDAVLKPWDYHQAISKLKKMKIQTLELSTQIQNREEYLKAPNLGRLLSKKSQKLLKSKSIKHQEVLWIISDGLSSLAVEKHGLKFISLAKKLLPESFSNPVLICPYSRVAISDAIGDILKPFISIVIIGERPGLSSPDSLGIYVTCNPQSGKQDGDRNCISSIRPPEGLSYKQAITKLNFLLNEISRLKLSGVQLKDNSIELEKLSGTY